VTSRPHLAYIISAYRNLGQVERLVRRLNQGSAHFLVHVDRKTDDREYNALARGLTDLDTVHFLERHTCHYGGFGHVRATLKGIDALVRADAQFDHAVLLTGQDYPIKPISEIEAFFAGNRASSFMGHHPLPSPSWSPRGGLSRVEYRHVRLYGRHLRLPGKRAFPTGLRPFGGGAYWCLSRECIELVATFVAERPDAVRFFERVDIPDEIFFQTIVMSSELAPTVVNDNLRYIDWSRGARPAVLGMADLEALRRSPKLVARKFDVTVDRQVLDAIDRELLAIDA
jgi:hypothetical protein